MLTSNPLYGSWLLSEANGQRSRANVIIASGQNLKDGAVLGKVTASGKYAVYDNAITPNGTEASAGILLGDVDASLADKDAVIIVRDAEFKKASVIWKAGVDAPATAVATAAGLVDLAALGIIGR